MAFKVLLLLGISLVSNLFISIHNRILNQMNAFCHVLFSVIPKFLKRSYCPWRNNWSTIFLFCIVFLPSLPFKLSQNLDSSLLKRSCSFSESKLPRSFLFNGKKHDLNVQRPYVKCVMLPINYDRCNALCDFLKAGGLSLFPSLAHLWVKFYTGNCVWKYCVSYIG